MNRSTVWIGLALSIIGCSTVEDLTQAVNLPEPDPTPSTSSNPPVPTPTAGTRYRWHDRHGDVVTEGEDLIKFDEQGYLWRLDPETGDAGGQVLEDQPYYPDVDCLSAWHVLAPVPRHVVELYDHATGEPRGLHVRLEDVASVCAVATAIDTWCEPLDTERCVPIVPRDALTRVTTAGPRPLEGPLYPTPVSW